MRWKLSARLRGACAVLSSVLLAGCQAPAGSGGAPPAGTPAATAGTADAALADRLEKLPTLPADLAASLDPKTNFTKASAPLSAPVKMTGRLAHAPCCSSKDQKSLKVNVALTKCGPLRDFVLAPLSDLVMAREAGGAGGGGAPGGTGAAAGGGNDVRAYKLGPVSRTSPWATIVCVTSNGPWDATFIEERHCNNYAPQDTLLVSAWGGLTGYYWNGGAANHPAGITVVSCRDIGTTRLPCGISSCDCTSAPCPANQPCVCTNPW